MTKRKEKKKVLAPVIIETLGVAEATKLRRYLFYLYQSARANKDFKAMGCVRGMYNQLWTLSQMVKTEGYRLPLRNPRPKKVTAGQLCLFE